MAARQLCKGLSLVRPQPKVASLIMDRPKALNAITLEMYTRMADTINEISLDKETTFITLEGKNNVYSSGNDLKSFAGVDFSDPEKLKDDLIFWADNCEYFVNSFIDSKKPIVAKVDGLSFGIMCTTLPLCDYVFATKRSTFTTPFTKIAQAPEGCSSYLFPRIFGDKLAREILLQNRTFDAETAAKHGFVNKLFDSREELEEHVQKEIDSMLDLPTRSFLSSREMIKTHERELLRKVNHIETRNLIERWGDADELLPTLAKFLQSKRK